MGKSLIIKGADFSENAIPLQTTWYVNEYDVTISKGVTPGHSAVAKYAGFTPNYDFGGKTINTLKFIPASAGKISLFIGDNLSDTSATKVRELTIDAAEVGEVTTKIFDDINVPSGKILWIGESDDTSTFMYADSSDTGAQENFSPFGGFYLLCGTANNEQVINYQCLTINWGYTE